MTKKESFWDKNWRPITHGLLIVAFIGGLAIIIIYLQDKYFDPEIHVCEECYLFQQGHKLDRYGVDCERLKDNNDFTCTQSRDKTPQELQIQICIDDPNNKDCKCIEEINIVKVYDKDHNFKFEKDMNSKGTLTANTGDIIESFYGCIKAIPKKKPIEINLEEER